jgi:hypothetical protein
MLRLKPETGFDRELGSNEARGGEWLSGPSEWHVQNPPLPLSPMNSKALPSPGFSKLQINANAMVQEEEPM